MSTVNLSTNSDFIIMAKKYFDIEISIYNGVRDVYGSTCKLRDFLFENKYVSEIEYLRSLSTKEERDNIKKRLPMACISGLFQPTRKTENLINHSGLICVDIDRKDNLHIDNWDDLKLQLSKLKEVAYISLSVSGNGYFVIMPLKYPQFHKQQFNKLKLDFAQLGINIDSACGDVTRMRCVSHDISPYINENAIPYAGYYTDPKPVIKYQYSNGDVLDKVAKCCNLIESNHIDITSDYKDWFTIGCALASLGENGRQFFHVCSMQSHKYKQAETDKKFSNLLRTGKRISIGSFFEICKDYGITFKNL